MLEEKTYKNYKAICEVMGWKIATGNTKISQLKQLECLCKYHKEGNKFIIEKIYDDPLDKIDNRGKKAEYGEHIDKLIIHECSIKNNFDIGENKILLSPTTLFLRLNMINHNYTDFRRHMNAISRYYKIPYETIFDFYDNTYARNKRLIEGSLNRLQKKSLIMWSLEKKVVLENGVTRLATDNEKTVIMDNELFALEKLHLDSKKDIFLHKKWNEFRKIVLNLLKMSSNIEIYFNCYKIISSTKFKNIILDNMELIKNQNELNSKIFSATIKDASNRQNKILEKYNINNSIGKIKTPYWNNEKNMTTKEYIEDTKIMGKLCINNCTSKIKFKWSEMNDDRYDFEESMMSELQLKQKEIEEMFTTEDLDELFGSL